jgi:hypothetical protein
MDQVHDKNSRWADNSDDDLFDNEEIYLYYLHKWADQNPDYTFSFIVPKGIPKKSNKITMNNNVIPSKANWVQVSNKSFSNRFKK